MEEGSVSLQTWLPAWEYYEEVVRRGNIPGTRWALVTLGEDDEADGQDLIPVTIG